jgi:hypothetical protein
MSPAMISATCHPILDPLCRQEPGSGAQEGGKFLLTRKGRRKHQCSLLFMFLKVVSQALRLWQYLIPLIGLAVGVLS